MNWKDLDKMIGNIIKSLVAIREIFTQQSERIDKLERRVAALEAERRSREPFGPTPAPSLPIQWPAQPQVMFDAKPLTEQMDNWSQKTLELVRKELMNHKSAS